MASSIVTNSFPHINMAVISNQDLLCSFINSSPTSPRPQIRTVPYICVQLHTSPKQHSHTRSIMSSHHKGKGRQKRPHSPEVGQGSRRRPAPNVSQDPQVAQVTQGFGNLGLTTASYGQSQYYGLPQPPMPTYRSGTHTVPGQLSTMDQNILWNAVASGSSFREIKDSFFHDRFDISARILENHARDIGALWGPDEDYALLHSGMTEHATEFGINHIRNSLQKDGYIRPIRSIMDMQARFAHLMREGRKYSLGNMPGERSSQGQQGHAYGTQADIPASTAAYQYYQAPGPSSYQAETFSQRRAGPTASSAQGYDVPQTATQPFSGGTQQIHGPQTGSRYYTDSEFDDIKIKIAQGLTYEEIAAMSECRRTVLSIAGVVKNRKYKRWPREQDLHLLELHKTFGDNWAEIRRQLHGPERSERETKARWEFCIEEYTPKNRHRYSLEDDDYIKLQLARGRTYQQMAAERFAGIHYSNIRRHAIQIHATWSEEDNQKLREKVLEYENRRLEVDWGSIGEHWDHPRPAWAVETRWNRLRGLLPPER